MMVGTGGAETAVRVLRGGAWNNDADNLRAAVRNRNHVWNRNNNVGFRCCVCRSPEHAFHDAVKPCRRPPGQPYVHIGRPNQHRPAVPVSAFVVTHRPAGHSFAGFSL